MSPTDPTFRGFRSRLTRRAITALATVVTGVVVLTGTATLNAPAATAAMEPDGSFTVFAHRGFPAGKYTENTLAALNNVTRAKLRATEIDVMPTADRKFLLNHDPTLERTTTCFGRVDKRTMAQIKKQCRGKQRREPLTSLDEALDWSARTNSMLMVEVKPGGRWDESDLTNLGALIDRSREPGRVSVLSRDRALLGFVEASMPHLSTHFIAETWSATLWGAKRFDGVNTPAHHLSRTRVGQLHARGAWVMGRNSNSSGDWSRIKRSGADSLMTDRPAAARPLQWR